MLDQTTEMTIAMPAGLTVDQVFADEAKINEIVAKITAEAEAAVSGLDASNAKDRKAMRSIAMRVSKSKVWLDTQGKDLTEEARAQIEAVNTARKTVTTSLDALRDKIKSPAEEWDAAEAERKAKIEAELYRFDVADLTIETPSAEIQARLDEVAAIEVGDAWGEYEHKAAGAKAQAIHDLETVLTASRQREAEQAELAQLRAQAAERARQDEERAAAEEAERARVQREKDEAERAQRLEAEKAEAAERARIEAEQQAERQRVAEAERHAAEIAAAKAEAERKIKAEAERVEAEKQAAQREADRRAADQELRDKIHAEIAAALSAMAGQATPEAIATALMNGKIPHVKVTL